MPGMASRRVAPAVVLAIYALAILAGATLVFLVQPLTARLLLPRFGGSPAVWTTSLLFFQVALLLGYGWAHLSTTRLGLRRQPWAQLALVLAPLLVLPIALPAWTSPPSGTEPAAWLLLVLAATVGLPYVAVTTASPVLQRWFAATDHPHAGDPYFLYAMGNAGSLLGLLAYPFLIEPNLTLREQATLWSAGYLSFVGLVAVAAVTLRLTRRAASAEATADASDSRSETEVSKPDRPIVRGRSAERPTVRRRLTWVVMAFVPSSLMLGVTTYITTDLAAVPLLWVLPLSLYLVTFIVAFSPRNPLTARRLAAILPIVVVVLAIALVGAVQLSLLALVALNLGAFFVAALLAHVRLADDRPAPSYLTEFYLLLAVGGALGGLFNALLAPAIFDGILEYPLAISLALLLRPGRPNPDPAAEHRARLLDLVIPAVVVVGTLALLVVLSRVFGFAGQALAGTLALVAIGLLVLARRPVRFGLAMGAILLIPLLVGRPTLFVDRGFFGVNRVVEEGGIRLMIHGTTTHGGQLTDPARSREPLTYYHRSGPFGRALTSFLGRRPGAVRYGVLGLGAAGIAAYVRPGDAITFFEIDPTVVRIAEDPALFTFLSGAPGAVRVVLGDGRQTVAEDPDGSFDVLVVDVFSGDAPPAHLLTVEAVDLYVRKLAPGGLLLFNVSNRYVEVQAVVVAALRARGLPVAIPVDPNPGSPPSPEKELSGWVTSARDAATLDAILGPVATTAPPPGAGRPWTDDFSDLISVIHWDR
jgi:SAM-dependent methyltransferase